MGVTVSLIALTCVIIMFAKWVKKYIKKKGPVVKPGESTLINTEETVETKRARVHRRIMESQWETIRKRIDYIDNEEEEEGTVSWVKSGSGSSYQGIYSCTGHISLGIERHSNSEKITPMPLLKENRLKLEELGFVVTEDQCYAIYKEREDVDM